MSNKKLSNTSSKSSSNISSKSSSNDSSTNNRKHTKSIFEFTARLWLHDSENALICILRKKAAAKLFMLYLKSEYSEAPLEFYLDAQNIDTLHCDDQPAEVIRVYNMYFSEGRNDFVRASTANNLNQSSKSKPYNPSTIKLMRKKIKQEAEVTISMLASNVFNRFLNSRNCKQILRALRFTGGASIAADTCITLDARGWLHEFVSMAESMPVSVAVSDMTYPGAPLVYINPEFTRITGYNRIEVIGHNCRFLQGPATEPEAIQVIHNTLSTAQDCHVKITNYRKNGECFQNLLSMKPVFDSDEIYRYVISFQFEIKSKDLNLLQLVLNFELLLSLIPSKLSYVPN